MRVGGSHVLEGHKLWEAYRAFETSLLGKALSSSSSSSSSVGGWVGGWLIY